MPSADGNTPVDFVETLLTSSALCWPCVATQSELPDYHVDVALKVLMRTRAIQLDVGPCDACRQPGAFRKL